MKYDFWVPEPTLKFHGIEEFLKKYQARAKEAGVDPVGYYLPPFAYAYLQVLGQAIEATKGLDQKKVAEYIRTHAFGTIAGDVKFGPNSEWAKSRVLQIQFHTITGTEIDQFMKPAKRVVLYPEEWKSGTLIYPYARRSSKRVTSRWKRGPRPLACAGGPHPADGALGEQVVGERLGGWLDIEVLVLPYSTVKSKAASCSGALRQLAPLIAAPDLDLEDGVDLPRTGPPVPHILNMRVVMEEPARDANTPLASAEIEECFMRPAGLRGLEVRGHLGDDLPVSGALRGTLRLRGLPQVDVEVSFVRRPPVRRSVSRVDHLSNIACQADCPPGMISDELPIRTGVTSPDSRESQEVREGHGCIV